MSDDEIKAYIKRAYDKYPHGQLESLTLDVDGEDVGIHYGLAPVKFDRIRRITGYLVGTLDRFNDAKRAEEHDRVKHEVPPAASNLAFSTHKENGRCEMLFATGLLFSQSESLQRQAAFQSAAQGDLVGEFQVAARPGSPLAGRVTFHAQGLDEPREIGSRGLPFDVGVHGEHHLGHVLATKTRPSARRCASRPGPTPSMGASTPPSTW